MAFFINMKKSPFEVQVMNIFMNNTRIFMPNQAVTNGILDSTVSSFDNTLLKHFTGVL